MSISSNFSRRNFIKVSSVVASASAIPLNLFATNQIDKSEPVESKFTYFDKQTRLTIAMWDFSWLTASHKGGAYENLEKCVAETAERGFNTLRVDCFPSRVIEGKTVFKKNTTLKNIVPFWGQSTVDHECNVLEKLAFLAKVCKQNNIWLGLDSWEKGHMIENDNLNPLVISEVIKRADEEKVLSDFSRTWVKALKLMREEGILESAVWVAPMNEVPHFGSRSLESVRKINSVVQNEGQTQIEKNQLLNTRYKQINNWLGEAIKDEIRKDKIPLSYSSLGAEEYSERLSDIYDVVDIHFMPYLPLDANQKAEFEKLGSGSSKNMRFDNYEKINLKDFSNLWNATCRKNYPQLLSRTRDYFENALKNLTLKNGKKLHGIITESYGPTFWPDHPDVSWEWYKNYNGDAARIAASMPYQGLSLSNFAEPIFSLWNDVDWLRNSNMYTLNILNG